jgi:hypothetical protein
MRSLSLLLLAAGCGGGPTMDMPDLSMTMGDAAPVTVAAAFAITGGGGPLAGVEVCVYPDKKICAMTDAAGAATLMGVPGNAEVMFSLARMGYQKELIQYTTAIDAITVSEALLTDAEAMAKALKVSLSIAGALAQIDARAGAADVTVSLAPTAGIGPYYLDTMANPDKMLTKSTANGEAWLLNVDAADYVVVFQSASGCTIQPSSWKGNMPGRARVKAVAGYWTNVDAKCP